MPYLDQPWRPPVEFPEGEWVPEMGHRSWLDRHSGLEHAAWVKRDGLEPGDVEALQALQPNDKSKYLKVLGADIGSVQRDGFLYANFMEDLKQAAPISDRDTGADAAADRVVERMKAMGMTSASLDEHHGGPPVGRSPRPWRAVMNWLSSLLYKVGRFLVNSIEAFLVLARDLLGAAANKTTVSFSASIPPAVSFDIGFDYFTDRENWATFKQFIDAILDQVGKLVES
jgi:hypothetical protein